jgi:hypothetical protein
MELQGLMVPQIVAVLVAAEAAQMLMVALVGFLQVVAVVVAEVILG